MNKAKILFELKIILDTYENSLLSSEKMPNDCNPNLPLSTFKNIFTALLW